MVVSKHKYRANWEDTQMFSQHWFGWFHTSRNTPVVLGQVAASNTLSSWIWNNISSKPGVLTCRATFPSRPTLKHYTATVGPVIPPQILYLSLTRASAYRIMCCLSSSCSSGALESKFRIFSQQETWSLLELTDVSCSSVDRTLNT